MPDIQVLERYYSVDKLAKIILTVHRSLQQNHLKDFTNSFNQTQQEQLSPHDDHAE